MPLRLTLSSKNLEQLQRVLDVGPAPLKNVADRLRSSETKVQSVGDLQSIIKIEVPDPDQLNAVFRQTLALATVKKNENTTADNVIEAITRKLDTSEWTPEHKKNWKNIVKPFTEIVKSEKITHLIKTLDLALDYANILRNVKIITDIRPVFDEDKTEIVGTIISQVMRLRYTSDSTDFNLSLALDEKDIKALRRACDDAISKMTKVQKLVEGKLNLPAVRPGEELYNVD